MLRALRAIRIKNLQIKEVDLSAKTCAEVDYADISNVIEKHNGDRKE